MNQTTQFNLIDQEDLSMLHKRLAAFGYASEEFVPLIAEYKKYLKMRVVHPEELPMYSLSIDDVWHAHILYTQSYRAFCDRVFGHYLDHRPYSAQEFEVHKKEYSSVTLRLYQELFHSKPPTYWMDTGY